MFLLKKKNQSVVGLDVGMREIKAVELSRVGNGYAVTRLATKPVVSEQAGVETLKNLAHEAGFRTSQTVSAVSGRSVVVRYITMHPMNNEELHTAMKYEAGKYIPFNLEDVVVDCQPLAGGVSEGRAGAEMKVLLVAVKRDHIMAHVGELNQAGYHTVVVDVDAFALGNAYNFVRSLSPEGPRDNVGIVDIGATKTSINVCCAGTSLFTREVYLGGNDFTNAISRHRGLNFFEAEGMKMDPATDEAELGASINLTLEELCNEIQMSFDYFENQFDAQVGEVLLTGGGAQMKGLAGNLTERFERPTQVWNPLSEIAVRADNIDEESLAAAGPRMAVALGLASRLATGRLS